MFKEYLTALKAIKAAFLNGEISKAMRLWSELQLKLADVYDMIMGNSLPTFAGPDDEADLAACVQLTDDVKKCAEECKPKFQTGHHATGPGATADVAAPAISPFEIIGLVKMGLDFAKMLFEAWKNRKNPAPTN